MVGKEVDISFFGKEILLTWTCCPVAGDGLPLVDAVHAELVRVGAGETHQGGVPVGHVELTGKSKFRQI